MMVVHSCTVASTGIPMVYPTQWIQIFSKKNTGFRTGTIKSSTAIFVIRHKHLTKIFFQTKGTVSVMLMPDSQRYPRNHFLLNNVEAIGVIRGFKVY